MSCGYSCSKAYALEYNRLCWECGDDIHVTPGVGTNVGAGVRTGVGTGDGAGGEGAGVGAGQFGWLGVQP